MSKLILNQYVNADIVPGQVGGLASAPPGMQMLPESKPDVAVQMEHLSNLQKQSRPLQHLEVSMGTTGQNAMPNQNLMYPKIGSESGLVGLNLGQRQPQLQGGQAAAQSQEPEQQGQQICYGESPTLSTVWQGTLTWTVSDAQGKRKNVCTSVVASMLNNMDRYDF